MVAKNKPWTHGAYVGGVEVPEHAIWRGIVARCTRPSAKDYDRYGGRGVGICETWLRYEQFLGDMGYRPSPDHSVDRIDVHGSYSASNCRWATRSEQQKNKRTTRWYTDGCFVGTLVECADHLHISKELASWRYKTWGSFEKETVWQERQKPL